MPLEEIWPGEIGELSRKVMSRVVGQPGIYRNAGALFRHAERVIDGERIILPLASDGMNSDGVLGASAYQHPLRTVANGSVELLSEAEEWFSLS